MTDEQLASELKKCSGKRPAHHPVGELLVRHWGAVFDYASLCTKGAQAGGMLTTAAFTRLFGESLRQTGPTAAWRPQLLATVRRIAEEWDLDQRKTLLHPALRSRSNSRERAEARLLPPRDRRLILRAFHRLPESIRCILWHTEVEAEALEIPAGLLGLTANDAAAELERARGLLRESCLRAHGELAPEELCRGYSRLLDVSVQRGGTDLDPDLRRHMARCEHCRYTAYQLDHSGGRLALLLAEAVIGWGAQAYLESRPGRRAPVADMDTHPHTHTHGEPDPTDSPLPGLRPGPHHSARRHSHAGSRPPADRDRPRFASGRQLALALLAVCGCALVPLALWIATSPADDDSAPNGGAAGLSSDTTVSGTHASWAAANGIPTEELRGPLRDTATGLCVDIAGGKAAKGTESVLASCTSAATQQWSYATDGLLRSLADPAFCLDSRSSFSIRLGPCTGASRPGADDVRYDFTVQGELVPRWNQGLAVVPVSPSDGAALVLKLRDDATSQRWQTVASEASPEWEPIASDAAGTPVQVAASRSAVPPHPTSTSDGRKGQR
ncbi:ricin-type beta-trefoil lectin domain protein [Streptomyces sp. NPDC059373]